MELQQSPLYATYIASLKWEIITLDSVRMFYKRIPFMGGLLKIQRPPRLPNPRKLIAIIDTLNIKTVAIEPAQDQPMNPYKKWAARVGKHARISCSEYMLTKTIRIPLPPPEEDIFRALSEAKRRAVRKAQKNGVVIQESNDIDNLIRIKNRSGGMLGFITTIGINTFWSIMSPRHATILLAYNPRHTIVGGVLLVFWNRIAYYWIAGASREGKKLFAPTLLVWEALRVAKKRRAAHFDFLGVWDERLPDKHPDWKGFTKFKEGFGGTCLYYPVC